MNEATAKAMN